MTAPVILVLGTPPRTIHDIQSYSQIWLHYLAPALTALGAQVMTAPWPSTHLSQSEMETYFETLELGGAQHVLAPGVRYFSLIPPSCVEILKRRVPGIVAHTHDGSMLDAAPCHITFTVKDNSADYPPGIGNNRHERHHRYNKYIGWAADPELCTPQQDPRVLSVLVDHCTYAHGNTDYSLQVLLELRHFVRSGLWKERFDAVQVRRMGNGRMEEVDVEHISIAPYTRHTVSYPEICEEYSRAHLFMVTHRESVGLSALEAATAGALVVTPDGFIPADRLQTIRHVAWERTIDWKKVMEGIDPVACRAQAMENSWENVAKRILAHLADPTVLALAA